MSATHTRRLTFKTQHNSRSPEKLNAEARPAKRARGVRAGNRATLATGPRGGRRRGDGPHAARGGRAAQASALLEPTTDKIIFKLKAQELF